MRVRTRDFFVVCALIAVGLAKARTLVPNGSLLKIFLISLPAFGAAIGYVAGKLKGLALGILLGTGAAFLCLAIMYWFRLF